MASGSGSPEGVRVAATISGVTSPVMSRLPMGVTPTRVGSSQVKSTTSSEWRRATPDSWMHRATSRAPMTPTMPSKRPPASTVSVWEPIMSGGALSSSPRRWPMRLLAASTRTARPASAMRSASHWRACL